MVQLLLAAGADPLATDFNGDTPCLLVMAIITLSLKIFIPTNLEIL